MVDVLIWEVQWIQKPISVSGQFELWVMQMIGAGCMIVMLLGILDLCDDGKTNYYSYCIVNGSVGIKQPFH